MGETPWSAIALFFVIVVLLGVMVCWARNTAPSDAETGQLPYNPESKKALESQRTNSIKDGSENEKIRYADI